MSTEPQYVGMGERLLNLGQALALIGLPAVVGWLLRRRSAKRAAAEKRRLLDAELRAASRATAEKRRLLDAELREAMAEVARKTADAVRWQLIQDYGHIGDKGYLEHGDQKIRRAAVLLDDVEAARKRLWIALGFPDPEEPTRPTLTGEEKRALLALRQTMRLQARDMNHEDRTTFIAEQQAQELVPVPDSRQDMFPPGATD